MAEIRPLTEPADQEAAAWLIKETIFSELEQQTFDKILARVQMADIALGATANRQLISVIDARISQSPWGPMVEVSDMATLPDYRRQGIGARLMRIVEEDAKQRGAKLANLFTLNTSRSFYQRLGYKDVFGTGEMYKRLAS